MAVNSFMPRGAWVVGALGFVALSAAVLWQHQPREPVASKVLLEALLADGKPHAVGTAEGAAHAERVAKALADAGVPVEFQRTEFASGFGPPLTLNNVLGRVKGRNPGPATLLTAHHDSVAAGPGAGDDGAGVVTVIEIARLLAKEGTERDVIFLLTDGEETGLYGAIAFASEHPWFEDVGAVVNLDARGVSGPCHVYEIGFGHRALVSMMQSALPRPSTSSLADEIYRTLMGNGSDFSVYRMAGLPGFNLAFIGGVEHYHQASDIPANLHAGSLGHMHETALALVRALDAAPPLPNGQSAELSKWRSRMLIGDPTALKEVRSTGLGSAPEPTAQSFASFGQRWILTFDIGLVPWFTAAIALVLLISFTIAWRRGVLECGAFLGAVGRLLITLFAMGGALAAIAAAMAIYGQTANSGWHRGVWPVPAWPWIASLWAVATIVGAALWQMIPRRDAWANASASAIMLLLILGTLAVLVPPSAAMMLPVVAVSAVAFLLASILPRSIARYAAAFAACMQLWALTASLMPLEPSLNDALGFQVGVLPVIVRPLLFVMAFCVLLPGASWGDRNIVTARPMVWAPVPVTTVSDTPREPSVTRFAVTDAPRGSVSDAPRIDDTEVPLRLEAEPTRRDDPNAPPKSGTRSPWAP